jgi:hypothetical protein
LGCGLRGHSNFRNALLINHEIYCRLSLNEPLDADNNANPKLSLKNCRITNAVRCPSPQNKPEPAEVKICNGYLTEELAIPPKGAAKFFSRLVFGRTLNL